jgi:transposase-like protein
MRQKGVANNLGRRPCNFTATKRRGRPAAIKALATLLYAMGNMSFCGIARLLNVSDVAVLKWIRQAALKLPEPEMVELVMLDEMHHFLKKDRKAWALASV